MDCQHKWGRKYRIKLEGKRLAKAAEERFLYTKDPEDVFGPLIEGEIIQRGKQGRGSASLTVRKCRKCGEREILNGWLVSGGMEYPIEAGGIIGPGFFSP